MGCRIWHFHGRRMLTTCQTAVAFAAHSKTTAVGKIKSRSRGRAQARSLESNRKNPTKQVSACSSEAKRICVRNIVQLVTFERTDGCCAVEPHPLVKLEWQRSLEIPRCGRPTWDVWVSKTVDNEGNNFEFIIMDYFGT